MQYKDIMVHLDHTHDAVKRLEMSIEICKKYSAKLNGAYIETPWQPPSVAVSNSSTSMMMTPPGAESISWLEEDQREHEKKEKANALKLKQYFIDQISQHKIFGEFNVSCGNLKEELISHSRYHDLSVIGFHYDDSSALSTFSSLAADIAIASGKPVLMLPENLGHKMSDVNACLYPRVHFPEKPLVAWNDSAESSRALQDALPILQSSDEVTLFLNKDHKLIHGREYETEQLHAYLKQHEIPCTFTESQDENASTGEKLLECAQNTRNDLIVMGAYGRSRLRELLLGGTTRYVLKHTHVPVLMSH